MQVSQYGSGASPLALVNVQAPKNGYAYVYISNASIQPVYFDNFQVGLVHSPIIEEDHYYAYGLKIAAISSNIVPTTYEGYVTNKNLYNDKELVDDGGLNWYDYGYRSYDAQIGRFPQLDPLTDDFPVLTPFQYAGDEPIGNVDVDGLEGASAVDASAGFAGHVANDLAPVVISASHVTNTLAPVTVVTYLPKATSTLNEALKIDNSLMVQLSKMLKSIQVARTAHAGADAPKPNTSLNILPSGSNPSNANFLPAGSAPYHQGEIRQHNPNGWERMRKPNAPLYGRLFYPIADNIWLTLQTFRGKAYRQHLGGGWATPNETVKAFTYTEALLIPYTKALEFEDAALSVGEGGWPLNNGAVPGTETSTLLKEGQTFDRYGYETGSYGSPDGTPYTQRSLKPGTDKLPLTKYRVLKPLEVEKSQIAPWFGEKGGGIQYKFNMSIEKLKLQGYIEEI